MTLITACPIHAHVGARPSLCADCARLLAASPAPLPRLRFDPRDEGRVQILRTIDDRGRERVSLRIYEEAR